MNVSRVGGGARLRGVRTPFRVRPTQPEYVWRATTTGGSAYVTPAYDIRFPEPAPTRVEGTGSLRSAPALLVATGEHDDRIPRLIAEEDDLLLLLV